MRDRGSIGVYLWILFGSTDPARRPVPVIGIVVVHGVIHHARNIHAGTEQKGMPGNRNQSKEAAIGESPNSNSIPIDIRQGLQIVARTRSIFGIFAAHVHINGGTPFGSVTNASPIV